MSVAKVVSKPAPPPAPASKSDPVPPSAQDASAFAAKIKKANADQNAKNARSARTARADELSALRAGAGDASGAGCGAGEQAIAAAGQRQQREQEQGNGNGAGDSLTRIAMADLAGDADASFLVDHLVPLTANDGMFEVLMPSGARLAIAMKASANRVQILISSDSATLADQLKRKKMELEQRLGRRIGKDVVLAVL